MTVKEVVELFSISDSQMAEYLWGDCVYGLPDEACEYLHNSLTPSQIRAFGEFVLKKADEIEMGENSHES